MITLFASSHNFKTKLYKLRQYYLAVRERRQLRKTRKPFELKGFALVDNIYNIRLVSKRSKGNLKWNFFI